MSKLPRGTPLGFKCRTAIRDAAEAFLGAGWKLPDLKAQNADLHKRLLAAIAAVDKAFSRDDEVRMVTTARELIVLWCEAAEAMPAGGAQAKTWE